MKTMITTTTNPKAGNFLKISNDLLASTKITSSEKLFFSYIIGWQNNGKVCFESNSNIATHLGKTVSGLRSLITRANKKYDFFQSTQYDIDLTRSDNATSTHEIKVDVDLLKKFLNVIVLPNEKEIIVPTAEMIANNPEAVEAPIKAEVLTGKALSEVNKHNHIIPPMLEETKYDVPTLEEKANNEEITDEEVRFQLENLLNDLKVKSRKVEDMDTYNKLDVLEKNFSDSPTELIIEYLHEISQLMSAKQ